MCVGTWLYILLPDRQKDIIMETISNQGELLLHVLSFALPQMPPSPPTLPGTRSATHNAQINELNRVRDAVRRGFAWVASLRTVNQGFRNVIDQPRTLSPYSNLWFLTAMSLELDPPIQLYAEGTYQQVCCALLDDKVEKARQGPRPSPRMMRTACLMIRHEPAPRQQHPSPLLSTAWQ